MPSSSPLIWPRIVARKLARPIARLVSATREIRAGNYACVAAEYAGIGETTFYRWLEQGEADAALFDTLEERLEATENRRLKRLPYHVNDPEFSAALVENFRQIAALGGADAAH